MLNFVFVCLFKTFVFVLFVCFVVFVCFLFDFVGFFLWGSSFVFFKKFSLFVCCCVMFVVFVVFVFGFFNPNIQESMMLKL